MPSYAVLTEVVRSVPAAARAAATDPTAYRDRHELVHRREAAAPNETWQADHALLGVLVSDARGALRRPWLAVVIDDHSRAVAGYALSTAAPCATRTALALRHAIWRKEDPGWPVCGIPERLYVDNGADFTSEHVAQAYAALKIQFVHSWPGRAAAGGSSASSARCATCSSRGCPSGSSAASPPRPGSTFTASAGASRRSCATSTTRAGMAAPARRRSRAGRRVASFPTCPRAWRRWTCCSCRWPSPARCSGLRLGGRRYVEPTLAAFVGELVEVLHDPRDPAEVRVYHQGDFVCRALSPEHVAAPNLDDIQEARRRARLAHRRGARGEALAGTEDAPASPPARRHGLRLHADDD